MNVFVVSIQFICFAHHSAAWQCEQALIALALANGCFIRAVSPCIGAGCCFCAGVKKVQWTFDSAAENTAPQKTEMFIDFLLYFVVSFA